MKQFVKQKFYGKLLQLLKFKRHKKIRTFISFSKKKLEFNPNIHFNYKKNEYFVKSLGPVYKTPLNSLTNHLHTFTNDLVTPHQLSTTQNNITKNGSINTNTNSNSNSNFFFQMKQQNTHIQDNSNLRISWQTLIKKKYKLNSFLFNLLCQYSRGRLKSILGKEYFSWYYTIPYKLSLSRFIGNKVLRSFYQNLSKKTLLNLHKKITIKAKRSSNSLSLNTSTKKKPYSSEVHVSPQSKNFIKFYNKKDIIKQINFNLENRLDSTLLRLFQYKSLYTKKYVFRPSFLSTFFAANKTVSGIYPQKSQSSLNLNAVASLTKGIHHILKIKSPWKNFSSLQIKQKINHGQIYINNKKVTSPNFQIKLNDKILIKGFIHNPLWSSLGSPMGKDKQSLRRVNGIIDFNNQNEQKAFLHSKITKNFKQDLSNTFFFHNFDNFWADSKSFFSSLEDPTAMEQVSSEGGENNNFSFNKIFSASISPSEHGFEKTPINSNLTTLNLIDPSAPSEQIISSGSLQGNDSQKITNKNLFLLSDYISKLKIKRFSEIFYLTYRNFFFLSKSSIFSHESFLSEQRCNNLNFYFQKVGFNQSIYLLWSLVCLLSIVSPKKNSWNSEIRNHIIRSSRNKENVSRIKLNKNKLYSQNMIQKNFRDLLSIKNFQTKLFQSDSKLKQNLVSTNISSGSHNILANVLLNHNQNPSWIFNKSLNCYASVVYGTRQCQWVQMQQQKYSGFYNKLYNKMQFFELELDFFQLSYRHYKRG